MQNSAKFALPVRRVSSLVSSISPLHRSPNHVQTIVQTIHRLGLRCVAGGAGGFVCIFSPGLAPSGAIATRTSTTDALWPPQRRQRPPEG
jgi:hypothetical protein